MSHRGTQPDARIAAVLLAAGQSLRMGADNKLLLDVAGEPLVRLTARHLLASRAVDVVAVLGHEADRVRGALAGLELRCVVNPDHRDGQMTSVHAGLAALATPCDGVMVCLADQPQLAAAEYDAMIAAFNARGEKSIVVPTHDGRRGNPVIFAWRHRETILGRRANLGCRSLIARNPDLVHAVSVASPRFVSDVDTPADFAALSD